MILNTGQRTDIPAFYSEWFFNRIKEGYVLVRNPFYPKLVTKYLLNPDVVDLIAFCTKNPKPMLNRLDELSSFNQFWFVSITPYGKEIEPKVPNKKEVVESFIQLSNKVGKDNIVLRYDHIFINEKYNLDYHVRSFDKLCSLVSNYTSTFVISFIDLYQKTIKNFPEVKEVDMYEKLYIGKEFSKIAKKYNLKIQSCCEDEILSQFGIDTKGCFTKEVVEKALKKTINIPANISKPRKECDCIIGNDIGAYNTCLHGCKYCYANYDYNLVLDNYKRHNPLSKMLIRDIEEQDIIKEAKQESYLDKSITLF